MSKLEFKPVQVHSVMNTAGWYAEYKPLEILQRYIYCYWVSYRHIKTICDSQIGGTKEIVAPDGCIDVLFSSDAGNNKVRNIIVGTLEEPILVDMEHEKLQTFGIRFLPGGLQAFIKESASQFTNRIVNLNDVFGNMNNGLNDKIFTALNIKAVVEIVNHFFVSKLSNDIPWENTFQNALDLICRTRGSISVKEVAQKEAVSEKQLTRIFYERTGVNTKVFARIIRFQNILRIINNRPDTSLVDIALQNGYYDQPHLIHDFKCFCGKTPTEYMLEEY